MTRRLVAATLLVLIQSAVVSVPAARETRAAGGCDPNYLPCIPPPPPDLDCSDIKIPVRVVGVDVHHLDGDHNGTGCESYGTPPPAPTPTPSPTDPAPVSPTPSCIADAAGTIAGVVIDQRAAQFVPVTPHRAFDTRRIGRGKICAGGTFTANFGEVPGATAVVLNLTATEASQAGFVTAWPTGLSRPNTSNLNLTGVGQTRPNLVVVPLGAQGGVSFFSENGTHLIADVVGYFVPDDSPDSGDGRLTSFTPERALDTRVGIGAPVGPLCAGCTMQLALAGRSGIPPTGVQAVVVNVTGTGALAGGFVTAWPTGPARPDTSTVNLAGPGDTAPNLAIVPLGADGSISLFSERGTELIVDVFGYISAGGSAGLFVPSAPGRWLDTRQPGSPVGGKLAPDGVVTYAGSGAAGSAAVMLNITGTASTAAGYVTAWPSGAARPNTSNLNLTDNDTRPNSAIIALGSDGAVSFFTERGTHLIVDVFGSFTR